MKTETKTETKTKCLKNPTCDIYAIFLYGRGFKDIKYHILSSQLVRFSLVNQNRADQDRTGQKRLQSRGPNFRTCVLVVLLVQRCLANPNPEFYCPRYLPVYPSHGTPNTNRESGWNSSESGERRKFLLGCRIGESDLSAKKTHCSTHQSHNRCK